MGSTQSTWVNYLLLLSLIKIKLLKTI